IRLGLEKSTVSRLVADLERQGLVARERDPANRRLYRLRTTDAGRALHRRLGTAFHHHYERWVAAMTAEERAALLTGLPALVRAVREYPVAWVAQPRTAAAGPHHPHAPAPAGADGQTEEAPA